MAHFAGGEMAKAFRENPKLDYHQDTADLMQRFATHEVSRYEGKVMNLAVAYALGLDNIAVRLGTNRAGASDAKQLWKRARPDLTKFDRELRAHWSNGNAIQTWGGAIVLCEEPRLDSGGNVQQTWEYRALNTLIQRSAAEQIKDAMIEADEIGLPLVLTVHDELVLESHRSEAQRDRRELKRILEASSRWDVPFLSDVKVAQTWKDAK